MPPRSEALSSDAVLAGVAAALSRCTTPEAAFQAFTESLQTCLPGLSAWVLVREKGEGGAAWLPSTCAPPFPEGLLSQPRSASASALASGEPLELRADAPDRAVAEAPYMRRAGGVWWLLPIPDVAPGGLVVLHHAEEGRLDPARAEIRAAVRLLRPHLAAAGGRREMERRIDERTAELALFYETSRALALAKTIDEVAAVLVENLGRPLDLAALALTAFGTERHDLIVEAVGPTGASSLRAFRKAVLKEAAAALGERLRRVAARTRRSGAGEHSPATPGAELHVPLSVQDRPIGLLSVRSTEPAIPEPRSRLLLTVASQAALTLDRVRAVEQAGMLRIRALLDSMRDGVLLVDRELKVLLANPAARRLGEVILGGPLPPRLGRLGSVDLAPLVAALARGEPPPGPVETKSDEAERVFQITVSPVHGVRGALEGAVLLLSDVTEQRWMQEQLAQSDRLSSLGAMISGFAHELNNPLASIMGYAQLVADDPDLRPEVRRKINAVNQEASRCHSIVQNLLRFARKQPPERRPVDLNSVVGSVVQLLGYQLQADGIIVDVDLGRSMPTVLGDFHALQQVFVNIVHNAHHAMKEKGGHGLLRIVTRCDGMTCRAEVSDTGVGILAENIKKIFDPFFSTKRIGQGTGLGLSIAYGTIQDHGGTIYARSRSGRGATFVVDLPAGAAIEEALPEAEPAAAAVERAPAGKRILVVDDERGLAEMICEALAAEGHLVESALDGVRAKEMLMEGRYDLIISDLKMPNMGGRELYDAVLRMDPSLARRIIFSTGDSVSAETQAFFQQVGNPYLSKPFNLRDLYRVVHMTLRDV